MSGSFEFTLHSPLTKEDWNKIADAEHEKTTYVTFQTPQGRQVRVLDKIIAEIEDIETYDGLYIDRAYVLQIIDKYKAESEE